MTSPVRRVHRSGPEERNHRLDDAPPEPVPVVLALGTNLGDREAVLRSAVRSLAGTPGLHVDRVSPIMETDPVGGPQQGAYLNAVVLGRSTLSPSGLLDGCQRIEAEHGRERLVRWGARTLDVDVVCYGALVDEDGRLTVPHPRAHLRAFVLVPWALVDAGAVLPGPRGGSAKELARAAADVDGVRAYPAEPLWPGAGGAG